jgi:mannan endo-1,4-beta-mannosidase
MGLFRLKEGTNTITLKPQYGYASYDTITISKAVSNDYSTATDTPCDPDATDETKALMKYLKSVYGEHILSGQQEIYGGGNDGDSELEFDWIEENFGVLPAIRGFDFMNYNPLYGWEDGTTDRIIDWVKNRNGIATACWHINIPVDFDNYEVGDAVDWTKCSYKNYQDSGSSFNTANVLVEGTKERAYFDLAVEDLAEQLLKLQDAGVPLIFRPLHEAQGNDNDNGGTSWFWWGDRGSAVYTELWKLLYTELTDDYGLHNIIWEFNSYDYSTSASWYPGDDYVDIVGYDKYNTVYNRHDGNTSGPNVDAIASTFKSLYDLTNGTKMVSMPENDTVPTVDNMVIENANWLYFCPWYGEHLMDSSKNDPETLKEIYTSEYCITLDELPSDLYVLSDSPVVSTTTAATTSADITTTTTTVVGDICYGDADCDGDVDVDDIVAVTCYVADPVANPLSDDALVNCDVYGGGDGVNGMDALSIQKFLVRIIDELPVTE